jgi:hypothetical protein
VTSHLAFRFSPDRMWALLAATSNLSKRRTVRLLDALFPF